MTKPVADGSPAVFADVAAGSHTVTLTGIAANCSTGVPDDRITVSVSAGAMAAAAFTVTCSPVVTTGTVAASVSTSGSNPDPAGYTITLDPGTTGAISMAVGVGGTATFPGVAAGLHTVAISGVAANCTAATPEQIVNVVAGGTANAAFSVTCTAPPAGDTFVLIGAGDIAACGSPDFARAEATATIIDAHPNATVVTFGDNANDTGSALEYQNCYQPTWGRHKARTWAALGDNDYDTPGALPSFDYFGERIGPRHKGFYSFDLGIWHVIVLNDNIDFAKGSEQDLWLQNDLATTPNKKCTVAIWHQPYVFSSGSKPGRSGPRKIIWERMYQAGVELTLHGHREWYERFAPMNVDLAVDHAKGIRSIIAGTGGENITPPKHQNGYNSEILGPRNAAGVLKLTLRADETYSWEFIPIPGASFTDSGSGTCH